MNRILLPPQVEGPQPTTGSGRYYARFSQSESFRGPGFGESRLWLFEAFDAGWFDEQERIADIDFQRFYEQAQLFVLELHVPESQLPRLGELESLAKAEDGDDDDPDAWFSIQVQPLAARPLVEDDLVVVVYFNLYLPGIPARLLEAQSVDTTTAERLQQAVNIDHIGDATEADVDTALANVSPIPWIVVLDVGQGNAISLCNNSGSTEVYFDLGGGVLANASTFPAALRNFCFSQNPPIILSHWDFDHWSSGPRDPNSLGRIWIAPRQPVGPMHLAFMATITLAGQLLLLPQTFPAKWRGQLYLERCNGRGRNHSGLALTVSELPGGAGEQMLFPGDARYPVVPSFNPAGYLSAVAPHHGGDMRNRTVPACPHQPSSRLVYSYGDPNTFSHPRLITRTDHHAAGWTDRRLAPGLPQYEVYETAHRSPAMLGHVLLSWRRTWGLPPVACGMRQCQLRAQQ